MKDQTTAVYAAEDVWKAKETSARVRFGDWNEVWPFYFRVAKACRENGWDIQPPPVKARRNALAAHYETASGTVFMPPYAKGGSWALKVGTALHEFAHHMTPGCGHGPEFRKAMVFCLTALGWDHELLEQCYAEAGLTTSKKRDDVTDLVTKMLNQADRGSTPEERLAFLEGAERLVAKHSLDLAILRKRQADADKSPEDRPTTGKMYPLTALPNVTYRNLTVALSTEIARAHGVRSILRGKALYVTFLGFPEDIAVTELMLGRITPMMFDEADQYLKSDEHRRSGTASVSARIAFCTSFAWTVGSRLRDAANAANEAAAKDEDPGAGVALILRQKELEVHDYVGAEFKKLGVRGAWKGSSTGNWDYNAGFRGSDAAMKANLYGRKELTS